MKIANLLMLAWELVILSVLIALATGHLTFSQISTFLMSLGG